MTWDSIFTTQRIGQKDTQPGKRSGYQHDFDRIVFSSSFRRLQNKTQVFPLPGSTFVHNRLTHSLEVASVGRSLGSMVGDKLSDEMDHSSKSYEFYRYELANVIAAGCNSVTETIEIMRAIANLSNSFGINSGVGYFASR